jgi:two-component system chemotaxis sensor kinase CheA
MDFLDPELVAEFAIESLEGLADIEQQLLSIESAGANIDVELVNAVFRTMHSIKGTAGFLGLDRIGGLAHRLEEVLNHMRNREIVPSSQLVTTMLSAADYMRQLISAVESSNEGDISEFVAGLEAFLPSAGLNRSAPAAGPKAVATTPPEPEHAPAVANAACPSLTDAVREFVIESYENLDQMERELVALEADPSAVSVVRGIFRTMHTIKGGAGFLALPRLEKLAHAAESLLGRLRDQTLSPSRAVIEVLLKTVDRCREGLRLLETQSSDAGFEVTSLIEQIDEVARHTARPAVAAPVAATKSPQPLPAVNAAEPVAMETEPSIKPTVDSSASEKSSAGMGEATIRVDVGLLDKLMMQVGELVLARNQIVQYAGRLPDSGFVGTAQRLNLITSELQESLMKTRMQPIGNVWSKFPRVVRDLAGQLGKQVRIEMEGRETELDKTIIEAIKDPLTHLVRNSVDHGIEPPEQRRQAGKAVEGTLRLRAYHEGGQVNIEIADDGAGLNLERIRRKAVERGLISAEQSTRMSDRDVSQLIFAPGFSTAEKVTSVSGRGVGMDVVRTNIERIGGTIDLISLPGQGTTMRIKIPLTLAIIPALIVANDGARYAIPQVNLLELVRLDPEKAQDSIEYIHGTPVYRLRGKLLPLVYLSERLFPGLKVAKHRANREAINIVVLRADNRHFGLIVDKVNDTEEIVVKPLGKQLKSIREYAGATIMGDGSIALILDVKRLAPTVAADGEQRACTTENAAASAASGRSVRQSMLVVDVDGDRQFAMPTSAVARLERIPAALIEHAQHREVIQYRGGILPLVRLADAVDLPTTPTGELQVVVHDRAEASFGLIVGRIVDICEVDAVPAERRAADEFIVGSMVIRDRVTDLIDLGALAHFTVSRRRHAVASEASV